MVLLVVALSGCGRDSPEATLEDYLERVSNTVDIEPDSGNPYQHLRAFPARRDRILVLEELRAGLLESLDFSQCGLLPLIAERNSSLGKVMKPSTELSYELRFFERLEPCHRSYSAKSVVEGDDFGRLLEETFRIKSANLEKVIWNGLFTSEALERNFSLSREPIPLLGNQGYGDSLRALESLQKLIDSIDDYRHNGQFRLPAQLQNLEQRYFALHSSEYGSQLIKSLALLTHYLNLTADSLERAQQRRPLCFNKTPSAKAKILNNVFFKYYAGKVQPYMARVQREGEPWLQRINALLDPHRLPVPAGVQQYRQQMLDMSAENGLWPRYQRAIKRHTKAWQQVLTQCGMMPGS